MPIVSLGAIAPPNDTNDTIDTGHRANEGVQPPRLVEHDLEALIRWFLRTEAPAAPIEMSPTDTITDPPLFWRRLKQVALTNRSPELTADLWRDLNRLREILGDGSA